MRVLAALLALSALAGCVHQPARSTAPAAAPAPSGPGVTPPSPPAVTPSPAGPAASASPAPGAAIPPSAAPSPPARASGATASRAPGPKRPASTPAPAAAAPGSNAAGPASAPSGPAPLDLASLEQRLRETHAIGVFTKLSLKNQVDDLLGQFRAFYAGQGGLTLGALRHSYELLLIKVVTLLQDADPGLATAVSSSREPIWTILSDRDRFNNL